MLRKPYPVIPRPPLPGLGIALLGAALFAAPAIADRSVRESHVIKVQAGPGEVVEADVTDLAVGESLSLATGSGRMVDILRSAEGVEIYLDGELLSAGLAGSPEEFATANAAVRQERIEIECEAVDVDACAESFAFVADGAVDPGTAQETGDHEVLVIRREIQED